MNSLMVVLPIAIAGLIGIILGFYYAKKEHEGAPKDRRATDKPASSAHTVTAAH